MKKVLIGILIFLIATTAFAEVKIPEDKRVKNLNSGCCVWCSIENLGNIHGVSRLKGIAKYRHDKYANKKIWVEGSYIIDSYGRWIQVEGPHWSTANEAPGTPDRVQEEFTRLKVTYKMQTHGNFSTKILKEAVDNNLGCAVGLKDYPNNGNRHMVTCTHIDDKKFVFVENNGSCQRHEKSREWFNEHWTGFTIIIYPQQEITK